MDSAPPAALRGPGGQAQARSTADSGWWGRGGGRARQTQLSRERPCGLRGGARSRPLRQDPEEAAEVAPGEK